MHDDELTAAIREVRLRVRARNPERSLGLNGLSVPDLMPIVHARDAAEAKVAAIGTVNPRRGGLKNWIVQSVKKLIARSLDWHVREQVEFNRGVMALRADDARCSGGNESVARGSRRASAQDPGRRADTDPADS